MSVRWNDLNDSLVCLRRQAPETDCSAGDNYSSPLTYSQYSRSGDLESLTLNKTFRSPHSRAACSHLSNPRPLIYHRFEVVTFAVFGWPMTCPITVFSR